MPLAVQGLETAALDTYADQLEEWLARVEEVGKKLMDLLTAFPGEFGDSYGAVMQAIERLVSLAQNVVGNSVTATTARNQLSAKLDELSELKTEERGIIKEFDNLQHVTSEDPHDLHGEIVVLAKDYTQKLQACAEEISVDDTLRLEVRYVWQADTADLSINVSSHWPVGMHVGSMRNSGMG